MKTEAELIISVRNGDKDAFNEMIKRYEPLIDSSVSSYITGEPFTGSDRDDLRQEALIALYNAAMSYDTEQSGVTFGLYAKICLANSLNSALRRHKRLRAAELGLCEQELSSEDVPYSCDFDSSDAELLIKRITGLLSEGENRVFRLYIRGNTVKSIAHKLGTSEKSVSNAIYRVRKKLSRLL